MPTIEVIPPALSQNHTTTTNRKSKPPLGWAYVPESIAPDPSKQYIPTTGPGKKRAAAENAIDNIANILDSSNLHDIATGGGGGLGGNISSNDPGFLTRYYTKTQITKIRTRLDDLSKDGVGRNEVEIPAALVKEINEGRWKAQDAKSRKEKEREANRKQANAVKKVLMSAKNWAHFAADEEVRLAHLATQQGGVQAARRKDRKDGKDGKDVLLKKGVEGDGDGDRDGHGDVDMVDDDMDDEEKAESVLLQFKSFEPLPSEDVIASLIKTPPLTYGAISASYSELFKSVPPRKFCCMCAYWGKIRCNVCGMTVCGLGCRVTHNVTEHPHR